jgi:hypothetical protein
MVPGSGASRMRMLGLFVSAVVLGVLVGCAGSGQDDQAKASLVAGSFVGQTAENEGALVALLASGPAEEGEDEREVRAYLCDGVEMDEWFRGTVSGNELDLSSDGGAQLEATLTPEAANGTITLDDGRYFTFAAKPAAYGSGLYNVNILEDLSFSGTSEAGGRLEGQIAQASDSEDLHMVTATGTSADGESFDSDPNKTWVSDPSPGDARLIVCRQCSHNLAGAGKRSVARPVMYSCLVECVPL